MAGPRIRMTCAALVTLALFGLPAAAGTAASSIPGAASVLAAAAQPAPGTGLSTIGRQGWEVQSTAVVTQSGDQVSSPGFATSDWLGVTPDDAGAPGTEIQALLQNRVCPLDPGFAIDGHSVFFSNNLQRCFGLLQNNGDHTVPEFAVPWWFRTDFQPDLRPGQTAELLVNGIVGQADVWVNGVEVGTQATVRGSFTRFTFDITDLVRPGTNSLALELFPNDPNLMLTQDNVDWNQISPDNYTGIQFPVQLHVSNALAIGNAFVTQNDAVDLSSAALTVKADVTNNTAAAQNATVSATISEPGGGSIHVSQAAALGPHATRTVTFTPSAFPELTIQQPQVWWPYQMGGQPLYRLQASVSRGGAVSDEAPAVTFGIRSVSTHMTAPSAMAPQGVRVFDINGHPFVFRGGGFVENLFLHYSAGDLANQISLIKSMGLNGIRTEGKEVPGDFYEQMDRAGILIDAGFQCCDAWQPDSRGVGVTAADFRVMYQSSLAIGRRLRDHPSVINFSWSDSPPISEQEAASLAGFAQAGFQEPIISSAEYLKSGMLGPSGEKEGPYDWVPPSYWYDSTHASHNAVDNDPSMTNVGGSWGFDSEQSAGHTVPTNDSIQRFLSAADQATLWQEPAAGQYHTNQEFTDGKWVSYHFGTLFNLDQAMRVRYGPWSGLPQYVQEGQVQNYEDTRAQFEAFVDHWNNFPTPSTGTVYWQLNKGWPTLLWSLYNSDYDTAGSYFGAKKANERLHAIYAYDDNSVTAANLSGVTQPDVSVESRVHALDGRVLDDQVVNGITLATQAVRNRLITPRVPAVTAPPAPAQTYFVELVLRQRGSVVDRNVYWLSTQQDVVDWTDTQGNPQALISQTASGLPQFGDLRALQGLPRTGVGAAASTRTAGDTSVTSVTITNPAAASTVAFFLRADVRRGTAAGQPQAGDNQVLPITWSDNDVTLWPGQSATLTATYRTALLGGATPVVSLGGWNVPGALVAAPATAAAAAAERAAAAQPGVERFAATDGSPLVTGSASPGDGAFGPPAAAPEHGKHVAWSITSVAQPRSLTQGDAADTFTLTVTNAGSAPTDGTTPVTLTDVVDPEVTMTSISGPGWTCDTSNDPTDVCTQTGGPGGTPAVLQPGQSYAPLTLTVQVPALAGFATQDSTAGLHATNGVSVTGGAPSLPRAVIAPETPVAGRPNLTADNALASAFRQGDPAAGYQITVLNQGGADTDGSPIVATVSVPAGETAVALYGSGWRCGLATTTCTRSGVLRAQNGEAPPITLIVSVSPDAPAQVTQRVTVSGGGQLAAPATVEAPTPIAAASAAPAPPPGLLTVRSAHAGAFAQGDAGDRYTLTVRNTGAQPTQGTVTVTDTLPAGLVATRMTGEGWSCSLQAVTLPTPANLFEPLNACARADALAPGASYPPITLTVAVADGARPELSNTVTVDGGGPTPASMTATERTPIEQRPDLSVTASSTGRGTPFAPFVRGDGADQHDSYTITVVNAGFAATSGTVTLAVDLPAGLTPVAMSGGDRWACALATATCATRPGVALPEGGQETITLQVAVSGSAPRSLLTSTQVSGGGEIDQSDDFAVAAVAVRERWTSGPGR